MSAESSAGAERPLTGSKMLSDQAWRAIAEALDLSTRHLEIVQAVLDDAKETAIADDLGISEHTVHTHLRRIYQRLQVHDRLELVQRIIVEFLRLTADLTSGLPPVCGYWASGKCPLQAKHGA